MKYNKLVRDKIPETIYQKGLNTIMHTVDDEEYSRKLKEKLKEEVDEYLNSGDDEELTDILEVIDTICDSNNIDKDKLMALKNKKIQGKGKFKDKIILDEIIERKE